jgi:RNA polymerase sigma-B factor
MSDHPSNYEDVTDMFRHLQTLDQESSAYRSQREAIIIRCLPLADHIADRFRNRGEPYEDLVQVARVGLLNAVNRFEVETGSDFLSFAVPTVMGEVRRYFRDYGWSVKVPRRLKDLNFQLTKARAELSQQFGRAPTASELAVQLDIDKEEVVQGVIAASAYSTVSDAMAWPADGHGEAMGARLAELDTNFDKVLAVVTVRPLLAALPERQRTVLKLRFFENMTQTQIAEQIGISQMHVSRLLARALATLRDQVQSPDASASDSTRLGRPRHTPPPRVALTPAG